MPNRLNNFNLSCHSFADTENLTPNCSPGIANCLIHCLTSQLLVELQTELANAATKQRRVLTRKPAAGITPKMCKLERYAGIECRTHFFVHRLGVRHAARPKCEAFCSLRHQHAQTVFHTNSAGLFCQLHEGRRQSCVRQVHRKRAFGEDAIGNSRGAPENAALVALTMMSNFSLIKSTKLPDAQPSAAPAECALSGVRLAI